MHRPRYREEKATQAAAVLLKRRGGKMSYLKLLKLLYLADREALIRWGRPITFDRPVSMPHGPVLSTTYSRIQDEIPPEGGSYWHRYITRCGNFEVELTDIALEIDQLSDAEEELLEEVFVKYGQYDQWELRDLLHRILPEWTNPHGSMVPIRYHDILIGAGVPEDDALAIEADIDALGRADHLLG